GRGSPWYRRVPLAPRGGHRRVVARAKGRVMFDVLSSHAADTPRKVLGHAMCAAFPLTLFVPVRDGSGRQSFLRPGRQLPGHTRPFAS
ncbi:hypothetical protein ACFQ8S_36750, partial [Streptomyces virginiae]|uniref:hypothetical protein n=1 Tax=Streptomyces virginiae TaxID=1961 RepID=UPI0036BEB363